MVKHGVWFLCVMMAAWLLVSIDSSSLTFASEEGTSRKWLGIYVGSFIPGYLVQASDIVEIYGPDKLNNNATGQMIDRLGTHCRNINGVALINYRLAFSIGRVPLNSGGIYEPGIFIHAMADCVKKVEAEK